MKSNTLEALVKAVSTTQESATSSRSDSSSLSMPLVKLEEMSNGHSQLDELAGVANAAGSLEKDSKNNAGVPLLDPMLAASLSYPFRFPLGISPFLLRPELTLADGFPNLSSSSAASNSVSALLSQSASTPSTVQMAASGSPTLSGTQLNPLANYLAFSPFLMNPFLSSTMGHDTNALAALANLNSLSLAGLGMLNPNLLNIMQSLSALKNPASTDSSNLSQEASSPTSGSTTIAASATSPSQSSRTSNNVSPPSKSLSLSGDEDSPSPTEMSNVAYKSASRKRSKVRVRKFFVCTIPGCGQSLTTRFSLRRHMKRHTGERPFTCDTCSKQFAEKSTLQRHMLSHSGEKPFKCSIQDCPKAFADLPNLKHHQRTVHKLHASSEGMTDIDSKPSAALATLADLFIANAK